MSKFNELVSHIANLKKSNIQQATIDVDFLHEALSEISPPLDSKDHVMATARVEVDGGKFGKE